MPGCTVPYSQMGSRLCRAISMVFLEWDPSGSVQCPSALGRLPAPAKMGFGLLCVRPPSPCPKGRHLRVGQAASLGHESLQQLQGSDRSLPPMPKNPPWAPRAER